MIDHIIAYNKTFVEQKLTLLSWKQLAWTELSGKTNYVKCYNHDADVHFP